MVIDLTKNQPKEERQKMSFEKTEEIAIINRNAKGWTVELNKISYNGRDPVYDLRSWSPDGRMGKGMTLTDQTLENLLIVLKAHLEGELPREEKEEENELEARLPQDFE
ncbi:hypothetical protein D358_00190 [Enterococcus faecalis RP2S-4]|uniref:Transcriptional coactivator p15 (PC4) C-terminal domain-containing protein n=1 Tax=Enterococcus faecalis RP2S-4 TaxID=1244145 RepID=A0ABC9TQG8_ENTFL|nr:hypothetical protein D358_00190 [Enterococcus faecalis RP2S-4]